MEGGRREVTNCWILLTWNEEESRGIKKEGIEDSVPSKTGVIRGNSSVRSLPIGRNTKLWWWLWCTINQFGHCNVYRHFTSEFKNRVNVKVLIFFFIWHLSYTRGRVGYFMFRVMLILRKVERNTLCWQHWYQCTVHNTWTHYAIFAIAYDIFVKKSFLIFDRKMNRLLSLPC